MRGEMKLEKGEGVKGYWGVAIKVKS